MLLNPVVIYFTRVVGSRVKDLNPGKSSAYEVFQQSLTGHLEAIIKFVQVTARNIIVSN